MTQHNALVRQAFILRLVPGSEAEYIRRHNPIWPELASLLKEYGVHNYSIFHDAPTGQLFGYMEIEDPARWKLAQSQPVYIKWRTSMTSLLVADPQGRLSNTKLGEVFHLA